MKGSSVASSKMHISLTDSKPMLKIRRKFDLKYRGKGKEIWCFDVASKQLNGFLWKNKPYKDKIGSKKDVSAKIYFLKVMNHVKQQILICQKERAIMVKVIYLIMSKKIINPCKKNRKIYFCYIFTRRK